VEYIKILKKKGVLKKICSSLQYIFLI
jgi:hypothetical protein